MPRYVTWHEGARVGWKVWSIDGAFSCLRSVLRPSLRFGGVRGCRWLGADLARGCARPHARPLRWLPLEASPPRADRAKTRLCSSALSRCALLLS
eukprot:1443948-Pleurochrysis_carterae.AAC.7